jgi:transcriptional regulator with XRE-family HTH domain
MKAEVNYQKLLNNKKIMSKNGRKLPMNEIEFDKAIIAQRILSERNLKGWTQKELHERVGTYSEKTVRDWEKGNTRIPTEGLIKLAEIFECDVNYLIGKYEYRTKEATDICKATGLSEAAVMVLQKENARLKDKNSIYAEAFQEPFTLITGFTSYLLENGQELFDTMLDYHSHKLNMRTTKSLPYYRQIEEAFNEAQGDISKLDLKQDGKSILPTKEEYFYIVLEGKLQEYYKSEQAKEEAAADKARHEKFIAEGDFTKEEKASLYEQVEKEFEDIDRTNETMGILRYLVDLYSLMELEHRQKYFKYELSDNFMELVRKYEKEGVEDGR